MLIIDLQRSVPQALLLIFECEHFMVVGKRVWDIAVVGLHFIFLDVG